MIIDTWPLKAVKNVYIQQHFCADLFSSEFGMFRPLGHQCECHCDYVSIVHFRLSATNLHQLYSVLFLRFLSLCPKYDTILKFADVLLHF